MFPFGHFVDARGDQRRLTRLPSRGAPRLEKAVPREVCQRIRERHRDLFRQSSDSMRWRSGRRELGRNTWFVALVITVGLLILTMLLLGTLVALPPRWRHSAGFLTSTDPMTAVTIAYLAMIISIFAIYLFSRRCWPRDHNSKLAIIIASEGLCPCCVYSLAGQRVQEDGCIVCPECGCAIRIEPDAPDGADRPG